MVGAPDVDDLIELALDELVVVIGDIGGEIGGRAVAAHHHVVLVLAQSGGDEPGSVCLLGDISTLLQQRHHLLVLAVIVEALLAEPDVEAHPKQLQVAPDLRHYFFQAQLAQFGYRLFRGEGEKAVFLLGDNLLRQLDHIVAEIAVGGHLGFFAQSLLVAGVEGTIESRHLAAGVVDIVFLFDVVALRRQDISQRAAQNRPPPVPDVEGAGGVDADELELDTAALAQVEVAVGFARRPDGVHLPGQPVVAQGEVDETGWGHGDAFDFGGGLNKGGYVLSNS